MHSRDDVRIVLIDELAEAFTVFEATQAGERLLAEVRGVCPATDVSAACNTLRARAIALRDAARTLIQTKGW